MRTGGAPARKSVFADLDRLAGVPAEFAARTYTPEAEWSKNEHRPQRRQRGEQQSAVALPVARIASPDAQVTGVLYEANR